MSIVSGVVSLAAGAVEFFSNLFNYLTQKQAYDAGQTAGQKQAADEQASTEQQVAVLTTEMQQQPKISTPTTVDQAALMSRIKQGDF